MSNERANNIKLQSGIDERFAVVKKEILDKGIDEKLADEIIYELNEYNTIFSDGLVDWIANLYDPEIGGFYYSNGARDTEGYMPDIESTNQAECFIREFFHVDIPQHIGERMAKWIKGLQDPNGYFYHTQWTKAESNHNPNRLGRDLWRAIATMNRFGYKPTYDTITGFKGDGLKADGTPVSTVAKKEKDANKDCQCSNEKDDAPNLSEIPARFLDKEHFEAYLASLDINNRSYGIGNLIAAQALEIKGRSEQLIKEGADYSLVDILVNWLNERQNPRTGLWTLYDTPDFDGANGLLKILAIYSSVEKPFPNPILAAKSAFAVLGNGEHLGSVCYVYNIWLTLRILNTHIKKYHNDENADKEMQDLRFAILQDAPRAIRETAKAVRSFMKEDGSFSYTMTHSCQTSQGMQVTLPDQNEGDVNASSICSQATFEFMYDVLGLTYVDPYTEEDGKRIISIMENLGPVVKKKQIVNDTPTTFEDSPLGEPNEEFVEIVKRSSGSIAIVPDPRENAKGNVLKLDSKADGMDSVILLSRQYRWGAPCFVFEGDLCFDKSCCDGYHTQVYMNNRVYLLAMKIQDGYVNIWDTSFSAESDLKVEQDFGYRIPLGEWFKLRIEYYDGEPTTLRAKTYVNDKLIAVSDNYYDHSRTKTLPDNIATPSSELRHVSIHVLEGQEGTVLMDNLICTKTDDTYVKSEENLKVNVDFGKKD